MLIFCQSSPARSSDFSSFSTAAAGAPSLLRKPWNLREVSNEVVQIHSYLRNHQVKGNILPESSIRHNVWSGISLKNSSKALQNHGGSIPGIGMPFARTRHSAKSKASIKSSSSKPPEEAAGSKSAARLKAWQNGEIRRVEPDGKLLDFLSGI